MRINYFLFLTLSICGLSGCSEKQLSVKATALHSGTQALLQAISIVDANTAWVSGHQATFARTVNSGESWEVFTYDLVDSLQFRDIHAFNSEEIVLMTAGTGSMSRIFLFSIEEGFEEVYVMPFEEGFLNTIEFWDERNGLAFGDSFNGQLFAMRTQDGGRNWTRIDPSRLPPAGKGEGGFAASGTCISLQPGGKAWIGTGAGGNSRVLYSEDYGTSWTYYEVPVVKGDAAGIASIHLVNELTGLIAGGDLAQPDAYTDNMAITTDGGQTWVLTASHPNIKGGLYGSDIIPVQDTYFFLVCGPEGIDYTWDMGATFTTLDTLNYWAVDLDETGKGYAAGKDGKILKIVLE